MKKKDLSRFDKTKDTLKMEDFIVNYLNDGNYVKCSRLTHRQLKSFNNPYVLALSFEFVATNAELVLANKILLVMDCYGHIAPYLNPHILKKIESLGSIEKQIIELKKIRINKLSELVSIWGKMQVLLYEKDQIEGTITILEEINRYAKISELGGKDYVKKY